MTVYINPHSFSRLESIKEDLPHALLLSGQPGIGLNTIARFLAIKNLASVIEPIDSKGAVNHATGTISVETIRELYDKTRAKQLTRQIFIIDSAERMSAGAQAAFLKLLEEPNNNVHFLLTSHFPRKILPTVRSRVQTFNIDPILKEQTDSLLNDFKITDAKKRKQLEYLAAGLPAELSRLIHSEEYFRSQAAIMADTRTFLTGSIYERLIIVNAYQKDRSKALQLLDSALAVTKKSIVDNPHSDLITQLNKLLTAREKIEANFSSRLQLTAFVLQ